MPRKGWTDKALDFVARHHLGKPLEKDDVRNATHGWFLLDFPENADSATNGRALHKQGIRADCVRPEVYNYAQEHRLWLD